MCVELDLTWGDRLYLNVYVPNVQVGGQVVTLSLSIAATRSLPGAVQADGRPVRQAGPQVM